MYNNLCRDNLLRSSVNKPGRRPGRRQSVPPFTSSVRVWERHAEQRETTMDHQVVQDLKNAVAALESGEESDVRRQLSNLAVLSGGESDGKRRSVWPIRRKMLRQKAKHMRKKRRPKRKLLCVHSADESTIAHPEGASAIAHPRILNHLDVPASFGQHVVGVGSSGPPASSEDDGSTALLRLLMSDDSNSASRRGDSELSSVCVTESELSDTAWEESCDADDELSCFETTSSMSARGSNLRAAVVSAARAASKHCYGDVEDAYEVDTGASDQDGRLHSMDVSGAEMDMSLASGDGAPCLSTPVVSISVSTEPICAVPPTASSGTPTSTLATCSSSRSGNDMCRLRSHDASKLTSSTSSIGGGNERQGTDSRLWSASAATGGFQLPPVNNSVVNGLRTLNRILIHFVNGRQRYLRLPAMHRRARRVVWRLASLYQLEWTVEGSASGRPQTSVLTCTKKSCIPDASRVDQFIKEASQVLAKPAGSSGILERLPFSSGCPSPAPVHQSLRFSMQDPLESEEMEADETSANDAGDGPRS